MTHLIADSGSTKTSWLAINTDGSRTEFETAGINPIRDSKEGIEAILSTITIKHSPYVLNFYGAGCLPPYSDSLHTLLQQHFPNTEICVESDLLGAAHALCGKEEGIACILGTGSNSCLYNGLQIVDNVSPLGYILGDEGSGAVLGRNLVGDLLKGQMNERLLKAFNSETGLTRADIIQKVYRETQPNRFLASLVPFLDRHREEEEIHQFLIANYRSFFRRNVVHYNRSDIPVSFVGGVAFTFQNELAEAARLEGFIIGRVLKRPIEAIADFLIS